ncbi:Phosphoethanolamine transferase eptB [Raoultella terrigena]|uniref:Phosphoethanolamine transferase eptB n=1 Tax=Raoultella terrigena TaxID=577 RepID=A0A4U9D2A6_RAOTE|nr:Phosphoethanolamine transferase eptB [Raoultella terrigena]
MELVATVLVTFFLLRILSLTGRRLWRILATLVVLFSAAASYYMTFLNVVIGYGIIASVMTTDIDLSQEVIGWHLVLWLVLVSALPLLFIWNNRCRDTLLRQIRTPGQRVKNIAIVLLAGLMVWGPIRLLEVRQKNVERNSEVDMPSYGGVIANSYLPSNWLSALGLYAWAQVDESSDNGSLITRRRNSPTLRRRGWMILTWCLSSARRPVGITWGFWAIAATPRPKLAQEKNLVAFRGYSCDTATKLSLRCMFVREGGAEDNPQRTLKEQNVFSVLHPAGLHRRSLRHAERDVVLQQYDGEHHRLSRADWRRAA